MRADATGTVGVQSQHGAGLPDVVLGWCRLKLIHRETKSTWCEEDTILVHGPVSVVKERKGREREERGVGGCRSDDDGSAEGGTGLQ